MTVTNPSRDELRAKFGEYSRTHDRRTRNELIEAHRPLATHLARRYANRGEPLDDLVQVAFVGMLKAVERFDLGRGLEFSTFATATVDGELKRHFRDKTWSVRVPRRSQELHLRLGPHYAHMRLHHLLQFMLNRKRVFTALGTIERFFGSLGGRFDLVVGRLRSVVLSGEGSRILPRAFPKDDQIGERIASKAVGPVQPGGALAGGEKARYAGHLGFRIDADTTHHVVRCGADLHWLLGYVESRQFLELVIHSGQLALDVLLGVGHP